MKQFNRQPHSQCTERNGGLGATYGALSLEGALFRALRGPATLQLCLALNLNDSSEKQGCEASRTNQITESNNGLFPLSLVGCVTSSPRSVDRSSFFGFSLAVLYSCTGLYHRNPALQYPENSGDTHPGSPEKHQADLFWNFP